MHIHRSKLEAALKLMEEGKSTRDVAKQTGLSFKQLKHVMRLSKAYIDIKDYGKRLEKLRHEKHLELQRLEHVNELLKRKTQELMAIEDKVNGILSFFNEEAKTFISFIETLVAALEKIRGCLGESVGALYTYASNSKRSSLGWVDPQKWEQALKLSKEWCGRLDEAIAFLKEQRERLKSYV
jgi:hypothetical protein